MTCFLVYADPRSQCSSVLTQVGVCRCTGVYIASRCEEAIKVRTRRCEANQNAEKTGGGHRRRGGGRKATAMKGHKVTEEGVLRGTETAKTTSVYKK